MNSGKPGPSTGNANPGSKGGGGNPEPGTQNAQAQPAPGNRNSGGGQDKWKSLWKTHGDKIIIGIFCILILLVVAIALFVVLTDLLSDEPDKDVQDAGLEEHNLYRAKHVDTNPLKLNQTLNKLAFKCADYYIKEAALKPQFFHTCPYKLILGENVGAGPMSEEHKASRRTGRVKTIVGLWYENIENYDFLAGEEKEGKKGASESFVNLVWRSTREMGIAEASHDEGFVVVAIYNPRGNSLNGNKSSEVGLRKDGSHLKAEKGSQNEDDEEENEDNQPDSEANEKQNEGNNQK